MAMSSNGEGIFRAVFQRGSVPNSKELQRITMLPVYDWEQDTELHEIGRYLENLYALPLREKCKPKCNHVEHVRGCVLCEKARLACVCGGSGRMRLRPVQIAALQAMHDHGGMQGNLRVGAGKTLISFLAGTVVKANRTLLLIPAALKGKTLREFAYLKRHWSEPARLHIISYELLSRDRGVEELEAYRPDLIVADEAHCLKNPRAVCTTRLQRYLTSHECSYVDISGTMSNRSIMEYYHRNLWALPDNGPLPKKYHEAKKWADALDEKTFELGRPSPGALLKLCTQRELKSIAEDRTEANVLRTVREAYGRRLFSAPGMVSTSEMFDGSMAIRVTTHEFTPGDAVVAAFRRIREHWELPDKQQIDNPAALWRHARELIQGFYYKWDPPPPIEWLMLRKIWSSVVRQILRDYQWIDPRTPLGVVRALDSNRITFGKSALKDWRAIANTYEPHTRSEWIDDACLVWAERWASRNKGIIWVYDVAFAKALAQRTKLPYYGSGGMCDNKFIENEPGTCIASIKANSRGRNLQLLHSKNLIVSVPPKGETLEQLIGRTHRDGQRADEVTVDIPLSCYEQWNVFRQARFDAEFAERTMRQPQKLNYADYVFAADESTIQHRHAAGDPLWCKDNARFFKGEQILNLREMK